MCISGIWVLRKYCKRFLQADQFAMQNVMTNDKNWLILKETIKQTLWSNKDIPCICKDKPHYSTEKAVKPSDIFLHISKEQLLSFNAGCLLLLLLLLLLSGNKPLPNKQEL